MIPLVGHVKELRDQKAVVERVAAETMKEYGVKVEYLVGTMIEVPRGALTADEVATRGAVLLVRHQRPDAADLRVLARRHRQVPRRLPGEEDPGARPVPVARHDRRRPAGADRLREGPGDAPDLKLGVCGEHGGDPSSIHFFQKVGPGLRQHVAVSRAGGAAGGGAGGDVGQGRRLGSRPFVIASREAR